MAHYSFPFPVLRADTLDFHESAKFTAEVQRPHGAGNATVRYTLSDNNLISRLIREDYAKFACVVCVPSTMYRTLEVFNEQLNFQDEENQIELQVTHNFDLENSLVSSSPFFRPVVIATEDIDGKIENSDRLDSIWEEVFIQRGAIIASAGWIRLGGGVEGMFILRQDEKLKEGMIRVEGNPTQDYRFNLYAEPNLYRKIRNCPRPLVSHRNSVLTHALSSAFRYIKSDFEKLDAEDIDGQEKYANLRILKNLLKDAGELDWTEEGFNADKAATAISPHFIPNFEHNDD